MKDSRWLQRVEIIAAISVVITLILLVVEVRANTKALERQVLLDRGSNVAVPFMEGPELLRAFEKVKAIDGWGPLEAEFMARYEMEPAQAVAWMFFLYKVWTGMEADFVYAGSSDELANAIEGLLAFPDNQLYWRHARDGYSAEFRAYVESLAASPPREERTYSDQEYHRAAIDGAYREWVDAANGRDLDRWASFLASEPLFLPPHHPPLRGALVIREFYADLFADDRFSLDCSQERVELAEALDMAWSTGSCESVFTGPDGRAARGSSKWAKLWVRLPNGDWKCAVNSWSTNGPSEFDSP